MNLLRSKEATLSVLVIALIAQIPHAAYVFTHIGKQQETWFSFGHGGAYAIALELAVLLFVVRNRQVESYGFAAVSILINLSYYNMHGVSVFSLGSFPAWLVSVALPVAIACYSHDIAHETVQHSFTTIDVPVQHSAEQPQLEMKPVAHTVEPVAAQRPTAAERRAQLETWLQNNIAVNVAQVAQQFEVSQTLIRRELRELRTL